MDASCGVSHRCGLDSGCGVDRGGSSDFLAQEYPYVTSTAIKKKQKNISDFTYSSKQHHYISGCYEEGKRGTEKLRMRPGRSPGLEDATPTLLSRRHRLGRSLCAPQRRKFTSLLI